MPPGPPRAPRAPFRGPHSQPGEARACGFCCCHSPPPASSSSSAAARLQANRSLSRAEYLFLPCPLSIHPLLHHINLCILALTGCSRRRIARPGANSLLTPLTNRASSQSRHAPTPAAIHNRLSASTIAWRSDTFSSTLTTFLCLAIVCRPRASCHRHHGRYRETRGSQQGASRKRRHHSRQTATPLTS